MSVPSVSRSHISYVACVPISSLMVIVLPEMIEAAWARAAPGREAASQNEALRMFFDELARLDRAPRLAVIAFHARPR